MLSENHSETKNPVVKQKRTIYDIMEVTAQSIAPKVTFISMLTLLVLSISMFAIVISYSKDLEIETGALSVALVIEIIIQLLIIVPFAIILSNAKNHRHPKLGIKLINIGLILNLVIVIITKFLNPTSLLSLILSIGVVIVFNITIITCLNNILSSYDTNRFEEMPKAISTVCIVFGSILIVAAVLSLGTAFKHTIYTIQFLNYICMATLYFSISGIIKHFNISVEYALRENQQIIMAEGTINNRISTYRCPRCNTKNPEGAEKCSSCGAILEK